MNKRDRELEAGTSAHYEDPAYYAVTYEDRTADVGFYAALAAETRGKVLEYGCGNGRIALPIARTGRRITAVDLAKPMLADFKKRLREEPREVAGRVTVRRGDMRSLRLPGQQFALVICPFNAFLHLYERSDVERFLARVGEHLAPGGRFVFDVSIPQATELARPPGKLYRTKPFEYPGVGRVRYGERFDYDPLRQVLFVAMEFEPESGAESFMTPLAHRQFFPAELEALLHYAGFRITKQWGDFDGPPSAESSSLVIEAKKRKKR